MKTKNIKVAYKNRYNESSITTVPKLQVEGKWLSELGFTVGSTVQVEYEEGSIHIRLLTAEEKAAREVQAAEEELKRKRAELKQLQRKLSWNPNNYQLVAESTEHYSTKH